MSIELYPSIAKIKRNGVYENLPGFVPETGAVATQQMIATSESSATAQYVHNKGEYFRLNDTLYQAIVKINVGDTIVVGTNCEVAVIGNDLTHVANSIAAYELGIATSAHNTGDYFMVGETLYVATADIQVGDTISTSTNCRKAVVGDELSGLKTAVTQLEDIVVVSPTEPISETNKIWVDSDADSVQVPTMEDLWDILPNVTLTNQTIASFNDGANAAVKNLVIDIETGQGGTGFTAVNITRTGKNLCPPTFRNGYYDANNDGAFIESSRWRASQKIKCLPNTDYYMSGSTYGSGGIYGNILCWDSDNNYIGVADNTGGVNKFTTINDAEWFAFYIGVDYITNNMQVELGSVTSYEPYIGTTYNITFPTEAGTVTDGEIDVINGKLLVGSTEYDIANVPTIETLNGSNSIWADTGAINSITYRANIQKYIENVLAST